MPVSILAQGSSHTPLLRPTPHLSPASLLPSHTLFLLSTHSSLCPLLSLPTPPRSPLAVKLAAGAAAALQVALATHPHDWVCHSGFGIAC